MLQFIPFSEYAPDAPRYHDPAKGAAGYSQRATNCVPRNKDAETGQVIYSPFPTMSPYSSALTTGCQGAFSTFSVAGEVDILAGDQNKLYKLSVAGPTWANVTKTAATYNTAPTDFWSFANFSDLVIATQQNFAVQAYNLATSPLFTDLSAAAPRAKFCAVARDFLILGNTIDGTSGTRPQRVWWSAIGDPTNWPTPGTPTAIQVQSDYQDIAGDQGQITGLITGVGHYDCAVFFERGISMLQYAGGNVIFDIIPVPGSKGTYAPKSIIQEGQLVFYYSEDGFRVFDGAQTSSIGFNRVDEKFANECSPSNIGKMVAASDPITKTIIWIYPGPNSQGTPDSALVYNWVKDAWSSLDLSSNQCQFIFRGQTFGLNMEALAVLYPNLDLVPFSLDSPVWSSNHPVLSGFDMSNRMNYFQGPAMSPSIETAQFQVGDGKNMPTDTRGVVMSARPAFNGSTAVTTVSIGHRDTLADGLVYDPPTMSNANGATDQRSAGRYFTSLVSITGAGLWDRLMGVEVDLKALGRR